MKKYLFIFLFLVTGFTSFGQKIHFSDTSDVWNMYFVSNNVIPQYGYSFSYSYKGNISYHNNKYNIMVNTNNKQVAYIREDTGKKQVYVKTPTINDTETLLYDYNLRLEDTIIYGSKVYHVTNLDTVLIDTIPYQTWVLQWDSASYVEQHYIIEGIGSIEGPLSLILQDDTTGHVFLKCFNHNGTTPALSHVVGLYFDNATSCNSTFGVGAGVKNVVNNNNTSLYPNPIDATSKIICSYSIPSGRLIINNDIGQTIVNTSFDNKDELPIGDKVHLPGIYFYRITDNQSGATYSGKFINR